MTDAATKQPYGATLIARAMEQVRDDARTYGDPTALINRKRIMIEAVLVAAGIAGAETKKDDGKPAPRVTPQVVTAIEAAGAIAGILNHPTPADALSRYIATGMGSAPMFEVWGEVAAKHIAGQAKQPAEPTPPAEPAAAPPGEDADPEQEIAAAFGVARSPVAAEG